MNPNVYEEQKFVVEEDGERWIMHYSSSHYILTVGDGDFSFSLSLARAFRTASNMVATSLDSFDMLKRKYKQAHSNLEELKILTADVFHEVDATRMRNHTDLRKKKFHRIIFNFPHAGFSGKEDDCKTIRKHRKLVLGFFKNASVMLRPDGEIHVNHKTTGPYLLWNLEELAMQNNLLLKECVDFKIEDYQGYNNKRGDSSRSDKPFPLGKCSTYKFIAVPKTKSSPLIPKSYDTTQKTPPYPLVIPSTFLPSETQIPLTGYVESKPVCVGTVGTFRIEDECFRIFPEYFHNVIATFGRSDQDLRYSPRECLRFGYDRYVREEPGRAMDGYIRLLHELYRIHILRSEELGEVLNSGYQLGARRDPDWEVLNSSYQLGARRDPDFIYGIMRV